MQYMQDRKQACKSNARYARQKVSLFLNLVSTLLGLLEAEEEEMADEARVTLLAVGNASRSVLVCVRTRASLCAAV